MTSVLLLSMMLSNIDDLGISPIKNAVKFRFTGDVLRFHLRFHFAFHRNKSLALNSQELCTLVRRHHQMNKQAFLI